MAVGILHLSIAGYLPLLVTAIAELCKLLEITITEVGVVNPWTIKGGLLRIATLGRLDSWLFESLS